MKRCLLLVLAAAVVLLAGGCDTVREAWEESMNTSGGRSGDWFSDEYKPKYLFALYAPVKYPRGLRELERQIVTFEGKRLWINTNQFFSSRHVLEIRKMPRTDVPGAYDLALRLSDSGVRIWTMLAQQFNHEPMIMLIDNYYQCSFNPQPLADVDTNWVVISYPFDEVTAKGMEKYAGKNFKHLNPPVN
ncbi:MAG: hypothetical protein IKZ31_02450 [Lentisphaeria bacterium]|nr:hypothetical protein [Lentisphaeria bacterium]